MPFPSPGDLTDPEVEPESPALQADSLSRSHQGSPFRELGGGKNGELLLNVHRVSIWEGEKGPGDGW